MSNGQETYVALPNGSYVHVPANAPPEQLSALRTKLKEFQPKQPEPEGAGTKIGRGAALGAFSGLGIPETQDPLEDFAKNLFKQAQTVEGKYGWKEALRANPAVAVPGSLARGFLDVTQDVNPAIDNLFRWLSNKTGGRKFAYKPVDLEQTSHDVTSMMTQLAMLKGGKKAAETPVSEGLAAKTVKGGAREFLGVSERAEKAARTESEAAAKEQLGKHAEKVEEAKVKDIEKTEAVKGKKAKEIRDAETERIERSKAQTKKSSLGVLKDRVAQKVAENLDLAEKAEEASLNKRYAPFNKVIDAGKFDLAELENAIGESRKEVFKGTVQNEPIFNSIMSRIKNKVELPSGETRAVPGENMITGDQLRGYISELGNEMFKGELPADVYKGLKNVRQAAKEMVQGYVDDAMGKQGGEAYRQLQRDWSHYEQTWYDRSSGSPLRNALKTIRTTGRNVSVYREVANQLLREVKGEQALQWLGKKKQFGANPDLVAQLRRVDKEMKSVKVPGEVGEVEPPNLPKPTEVKPPDIKQFDPQQWRRETITKEGERLSHATGWDVAALGYSLREILQGKPPYALTYPIGKRVLDWMIKNPKALDWLVK